MRVLILGNYFAPETVGAGIWVTQLAEDLSARGHRVTVLTSLPSYPGGRVLGGYRNRLWQREQRGSVEVIRSFTYATPSRAFWPRVASFGAFCASAMLAGLLARIEADVVYAILPPLPLGVSGRILASIRGARLVVNVQDIYPDIAVALGFLRRPAAIRFFQGMERWIYRHAERVVVVSEGFRENLLAKGVPASKLAVAPNWADPDAIQPGERANGFRRELGVNGQFLVVYSGGLTHNTDLMPILEAARQLVSEPVVFVIVGDGAQKDALARRAAELNLQNVVFRPFQPLERYGEVLAAADATLVSLNAAASFLSAPSKVYKQMAAARPIIALTEPGNELARLLESSGAGVRVAPGDPAALSATVRHLMREGPALETMGQRARKYLLQECSRSKGVDRLEQVLLEAARL